MPKKKNVAPLNALHTTSRPDWGTPPLLKRFAAVVLRPAAMGAAIDLDYASSAYWHHWWPDAKDRPGAFLDGSKGRDVRIAEDRYATCPRIGSGFFNPPGLGGGAMVQQCWKIFEEDHRSGLMGSGVWVGFSLEQTASLQGDAERHPLTTAESDLITTLVPSRRARYVAHPEVLIALIEKKRARRKKNSPKWKAEGRQLEKLHARTNDQPVSGPAPTHSSYITVLWARNRAVRKSQMDAARKFLAAQADDKKSLLQTYAAIGPLALAWKK